MMRGGSFPGGFEIKSPNEQAMELPKPLDTKSIPERGSELGETSDLHDVRHEGIENAEKSASDIQKPLIDDNGNEISDKDGNLKPNITYSLFGIEYSTDDNGNIYCIDGEPLCNVTYVVDGHEYKTDDNGKVYCCDGVCISNDSYVIDGHRYYTDDNGQNYKIDNSLIPNCEYIVNDVTYTTDDKGRIISWKGKPKYTPENERDEGAQTESGGEDRQDKDDGGHLMARILGGSSGSENIVPMRSTINRGDYKKSENEIVDAVKNGQDVQDSGKIIFEGDSSRPTKIERTYVVDGKKNTLTVDNVEGSKDLLGDVAGSISDEDLNSLRDEIADMEEDGCEVSVTSVLKRYDTDGNLVSIRVGIRNETTGEKSYKTFEPRKED